jgi:hypothetical protein
VRIPATEAPVVTCVFQLHRCGLPARTTVRGGRRGEEEWAHNYVPTRCLLSWLRNTARVSLMNGLTADWSRAAIPDVMAGKKNTVNVCQ